VKAYSTGNGTDGSCIYTILFTAVAIYGMVGSPKLYDQCIIGSIRFEFSAFFKGDLAGVC